METRLTREIGLNIPLCSAPMDTVTEAKMATALALEGGIGIIHKNLSIERQRKEVDRVKRHVTGVIPDPITLPSSAKVGDALALVRKYGFSCFPVISDGKLGGILSNRDMRFISDLELRVDKIMTPSEKLVTAGEDVTIEEAQILLRDNKVEKLLIVDSSRNLKGMMTMKDIEKAQLFPDAAKDAKGRLRVGAAVGAGPDKLERAQEMIRYGCDVLVVDTAHGHQETVIQTVRDLKRLHGDAQVIAGNVATAQAVKALVDAGADAVKVGIGPGSICTTRIVAGVGVPQVSAIVDCVSEAVKSDTPIIADGGIKHSGDVVKALAAGAETVMIGSLFAGVDESPGEKVMFHGRIYKDYRGMGSIGAMTEGSAERYFQGQQISGVKLVPEGVEARVPYKGALSFVVNQLVGGVRSGMGYCGSADFKELREKSRFIRISSAGYKESHVHDVQVTKEAPNYSPST